MSADLWALVQQWRAEADRLGIQEGFRLADCANELAYLLSFRAGVEEALRQAVAAYEAVPAGPPWLPTFLEERRVIEAARAWAALEKKP